MCADKKLFSLYQESSTRTVSMGNGSMAHVLGEGQVKLELSSGNFIVLDGVYHISDIRKNLISTSLLVQQGYKVVFESNRVVITRHGNFIGKGYICDGLFKLNLMSHSINKISNISSFVANVECSNMWHARLGHVNLNSIKRMMSLNLIPKAFIDLKKNVKHVFKQSNLERVLLHVLKEKLTCLNWFIVIYVIVMMC